MGKRKLKLTLAGCAIVATVAGAFIYVAKDAQGFSFSSNALGESVEKTMTIIVSGSSYIFDGSSRSGIDYASKNLSKSDNKFVFGSNSAFGSTSAINNIISLTLTRAAGSTGTCKVSVAYKKGIYATHTEDAFSEGNSKTIDFTGSWGAPMPRYFLIESTDGVSLSSISFKYGCGDAYSASPTANPGYNASYYITSAGVITNANTGPVLGVIGADNASGINTRNTQSSMTGTKVLTLTGALSIADSEMNAISFSPANVTLLDLREFENSTNDSLFRGMADLTDVILGSTAASSTGNWFSGCLNLRRIYLPDGYEGTPAASSGRPFGSYFSTDDRYKYFFKFTDNKADTVGRKWAYDDFGRPYVVCNNEW